MKLHPTASSQHRFHFLDALRGIASILVVFLHTPRYIQFRPVHNSHLAVDFFFCLSGFVIAFSYEQRLQNTLSLKRFLVARVVRLYPTYLLGIALGTVAFFAFDFHLRMTHTVAARLFALFFLQTLMLPPLRLWWSISLFPLDFPAWSMFFEMLANLAYAWMVRRRLASFRVIFGIVLISLVVTSCWLLHGGTIGVGEMRAWSSLLGIPRVAFSFLFGVLIFRLFRRQGAPRWAPPSSGVIAIAAVSVMIFVLAGPFATMQARPFTLFSVAALFPAIVYLGARCRLSALWQGPCTFLGELSYPLYLLHVPFIKVLSMPWIMRAALRHPAAQFALVPGVIVIAGAFSLLASKYYDVPVRRSLTRRYNAYLLRQAMPTRA
jgi:peptidoglycan/LPS O-acetylase OafA/YrhL